MKISGFTFVRNCTIMGYPFVESIRSLLPLVDEFVVNVGESDDDTYERVAAIGDPKIRIIRSIWNEGMHSRAFVYAQQKMIAQYSCTGDWAFYLEGDEVVHENDLDRIRDSMQRHLNNPGVEALAFHYHHLYGRPDQKFITGALCRNEVRVIRNTIRSYAPDGLWWLIIPKGRNGRYPRAAHTGAYIYHYGWVRPGAAMMEKAKRIFQYWDQTPPASFNYGNIDPKSLAPFTGEHPRAMQEWLENVANWEFELNPDYKLTKREKKHRVLTKVWQMFGWDFSKRHYSAVE